MTNLVAGPRRSSKALPKTKLAPKKVIITVWWSDAHLIRMLSHLLSLTLCHSMDCSLPSSFVHGNSPGKTTGVGCHALLQGIFPIQGLNPCLVYAALVGGFFTTSSTWEALLYILTSYIFEKTSAVRRTANFKAHC